MVEVNPLWNGTGNILGFVLDGKSYRQGKATAQTPTEPEVRSARISVSLKYACDRWDLVAN